MRISRRFFILSFASVALLIFSGKFKNLFLKKPPTTDPSKAQKYFNGYFEKLFFRENDTVEYFFSTNNSDIEKIKKVQIFDALSDKLIYDESVSIVLNTNTEGCLSYKGRGCQYASRWALSADKLGQGYYKIVLIGENESASSPSFFGIRKGTIHNSAKSIGVVFPEFTWQAYNETGGGSLYSPNPSNLYRVSLLRPVPYEGHHGPAGTLVFIRKLLAFGFEVLPLSNSDIHFNPEIFKSIKTILFTTHDEYWSQEMRSNIETFVENGGHTAIFGGNFCWWKINVKFPEILVDKTDSEKKIDMAFSGTGHWYSNAVKKPETSTFGLSYKYAGYPIQIKVPKEKLSNFKISDKEYRRSSGMFVMDIKHEIFKGLQLKKGGYFGTNSNLIQVEIDGVPIDENENLKPIEGLSTPTKMKLLAGATVYNAHSPDAPITRVATIADILYGNGRIMHMGSIGWYKALEKDDQICNKIFENTIFALMK